MERNPRHIDVITPFEHFTLKDSSGYYPDTVFDGWLIAKTQSSIWPLWLCPSRFDMELYRTVGGNYVCRKVSPVGHTIRIVSTEKDIVEFFRYCKTAKELYKRAGINYSAGVNFIE